MTLYADTPGRRTRQILSDLLVLAWTALWVWLGVALYRLIEQLATPGQRLESAGNGLGSRLHDAGDSAGRVPLVGDNLRSALDRAAGTGTDLADAGRAQQHAVHHVALLRAVALVVVMGGVALAGWLLVRVRWAREATAARRLLGAGAPELFALRALTRRPVRALARVAGPDTDPAAAWRRGDPEIVAALADLELRRLGLRRRGAF